ncbi:MAG: ABC transporter substrate-binding protein [Chloroflexales bacterium]|nr:ABC transporter substrate-binding protein [Chloroflexales bacterium]
MPRQWLRLLPCLLLILAACGSPAATTPATDTTAAAPVETAGTVVSTAAPTAAAAGGDFEQSYRDMAFEQVAAAAKGQTVNWYMWGGSDSINAYVNGYIAKTLKEKYDVTLKQVPVSDAPEFVSKVLAEKQAGRDADGSVDLMWINGENFRTLKEANAVFKNWADLLPSSKYVDWTNPSVAYDFGFPVEYDESPWGSAQFVMEYDSAKLPNPPTTVEALLKWACENKGKFTYPAPPDFTGSVFARHVFYSAAGDYKRLLTPFDQAVYDEVAAKTWQMLNDVKPCLWREGSTYPESSTKLNELLANGEVWISMNYSPSHAANEIAKGAYPDTVRTWVFDGGTIGNTNYLAIPYNSPNKAAAMVLADLLLSPEAQLEGAKPDVMAWNTPLDFAKLPADIVSQFKALPRSPATLDDATLNAKKLSELQSPWLTKIEADWKANVLEK